jgi:hypothetical protein
MFRIAHAPQPAVWSADKKREPVPVACDAELSVSKRNWLKITRGHNVTIRGSGYYYEGDFRWDYWHFSGALDGKLTVSYGSPKNGDYSGDGFIGDKIKTP